jgi:hypothetical protein
LADGKVYVAQTGYVQFDPNERDNNGQKLVDFTIKCTGKPLNIRVTLWPELSHAEVRKGDFIGVEGTFQQSTWQDDEGTKRTSNQINAYHLNVNGTRIERNESEREVVEKTGEDLPF